MGVNDLYYDEKEQKLVGNVQSKIRKWLKLNLIKHVGLTVYEVHPILGYNSTIHLVDLSEPCCSCQGYNQRGGCSHITAVQLFLKQGRNTWQ